MDLKSAALRKRKNGKELELRKDQVANSLTSVQTDSLVSMPMNGINTPVKSTEKTMEKENSMKETLPKSTQKKSQTTTYLSEDFHARRLVSQENAEDLTIQEALSFLKSHESVVQKSPDLYYLKTSKAYLATTLEKLSRQSLKFSPTSGIFYNGKFSIVKTSECRRIGKECSLSDILEEHPGQKYFLSQEKVKTMVLGLKAE